ncbi:MAG: NAD-dependent deacylase [Nitrosopumilus sp. H13]|nr:MAG: NAD-dependent deacylase [Nitrosopumilus sp. H13]
MSVFGPVLERARAAKRVVFVTGAGISQESGIPTFRGEDGLWRNHDAMKLATIGAFEENPGLVWEWYADRRKNILSALPNPGHAAVAELERHVSVSVLTQNVDGLHQRAGSSEVLELHGSIIRTRCTSCDFAQEIPSGLPGSPPLCGCGSMLRPDVVWFGEELPQEVWSEAMSIASGCDFMVVAGTSLEVSPANMLPLQAKRNGATLVEINPDPTPMSSEMDLAVREKCSACLPELVSAFESRN